MWFCIQLLHTPWRPGLPDGLLTWSCIQLFHTPWRPGLHDGLLTRMSRSLTYHTVTEPSKPGFEIQLSPHRRQETWSCTQYNSNHDNMSLLNMTLYRIQSLQYEPSEPVLVYNSPLYRMPETWSCIQLSTIQETRNLVLYNSQQEPNELGPEHNSPLYRILESWLCHIILTKEPK